MLNTTIKKVYASYSSETLKKALSEVTKRVYSARLTLFHSTMDPYYFQYHFYFHAQYKGIQRVARKWGLKANDLSCLVEEYFPEGIYPEWPY